MSNDINRQNRIAAARKALAEAYAANPDAVVRFEARKAKLEAAARRERERVAHLVLGEKRPDPDLTRPAGMSRQEWKIERQRRREAGGRLAAPEIEARLALKERWSHKQYGTPETWERDGKHTDCLLQMERNGSITKDQKEWADAISNVQRSIESEVAVKIASLEARVDNATGNRNRVAEGVKRVRLHSAYTHWRSLLPAPKQLILDMIVGDRVGYSVAAVRYRVHHRRARRLLLEALDRWPDCVDHAYRTISAADVLRAA